MRGVTVAKTIVQQARLAGQTKRMKRLENIVLTYQDVCKAQKRAADGHRGKKPVESFLSSKDENCVDMFNRLQDDSWCEDLSYRKLEKTNTNGKRRKIDSPTFRTRIYQHLLLNILEPFYQKKDNLNGLNCKTGCGITAKDPKKSVVHRMKQLFYDRLDLNYVLVIDQRKCYEHVSKKAVRRALKRMVSDKWLVDYAIGVSFVDGKLPIGTPTSPFIHHILMLAFDYHVRTFSPFTIRYADDNCLAFHTKEEANAAKWRVKNYWWYVLGIRAKRHTVKVQPLSVPLDFCGFEFHRNGKGKTCHDKGFVTVRRSTVKRAMQCRTDEAWASYFGLMKHADAYRLMQTIEQRMKLRSLTEKIRIDRSMDARHIEVRDLVGVPITIYDYEIRYNSQKEANWIKCLVGVEETVDGAKTGKILAYEFHGNYQGIIQFILAAEKSYGKHALLPLEEAEIENQCGYIFKGSTNQLIYIENEIN